MSGSNKKAKQKLERLFGKICFIEYLGIRNIPKSQRRKIKGYTKYDDVITYHHIRERHNGGKATVENGALIRGYNHRWLHSLPEDQKREINNRMLEFKAGKLQVTDKGLQTDQPISIDIGEIDEENCLTIPLIDNTPKDINKKEKFSRAKQKRELQKEIQDYYNSLDD